MQTKTISYQECLGIQNRKRTEDLKQPAAYPRDLTYEVSIADNIDIDNAHMPNRRKGFDLLGSYGLRSMWANKSKTKAYCVKNNNLCALNIAAGFPVLMYGVQPPVVFQEVNDMTFFTNERIIGYIQEGVAQLVPNTTQLFRLPLPAGQCMEYFRGRVYVGRGKTLWFSDAFRYFRLDGRRNFKQFPDEIDIIATAHGSGLYVVAGNITYFLEGQNPHKFELRSVAGYGAYRGTRTEAFRSKIGESTQAEDDHEVPVWTAHEGIVAGLPGGNLKNMTLDKYIMPIGLSAASMINMNVNNEGFSQFITSIK
jgi:hypothetical protein